MSINHKYQKERKPVSKLSPWESNNLSSVRLCRTPPFVKGGPAISDIDYYLQLPLAPSCSDGSGSLPNLSCWVNDCFSLEIKLAHWFLALAFNFQTLKAKAIIYIVAYTALKDGVRIQIYTSVILPNISYWVNT